MSDITNSTEPQVSEAPITVTLDSTVTPITQTPIEKVAANAWDVTPVSDLYVELSTLQSRYFALIEMHKFDMAKQVEFGIVHLQNLITIKNAQAQQKKTTGA